ncbi:MAG: rhodanese-like domain-containing protein [Phycisphaerales bacterium]
MHITSGLLSIVGAAFLFGTGHALLIEPINIAKVSTRTDGEVTGGQGRRGDPGETDPLPDEPAETDAGAEEPAEETASPQSPIEIDVPAEVLDAPVPEGTLTLRQSYELWEQGAYFIDARHEHEFEEGHIQYAAWLASSLFDTDSDRAFAIAQSMPPESTVVIYCVGGECDASHNTARRLEQIGFTDLRIMGVGYTDWVDAGFPTGEGSAP